jgi:hypothetical protein
MVLAIILFMGAVGVRAPQPGGRLMFHVFAALAKFMRELIVDGTREGLAAARPRRAAGLTARDDTRTGPPRPRPAVRPRRTRSPRSPGRSTVSRCTIDKYVPVLGHHARDTAPALDAVLAALREDTRHTPDVTRFDALLPRTARQVMAGETFLPDTPCRGDGGRPALAPITAVVCVGIEINSCPRSPGAWSWPPLIGRPPRRPAEQGE